MLVEQGKDTLGESSSCSKQIWLSVSTRREKPCQLRLLAPPKCFALVQAGTKRSRCIPVPQTQARGQHVCVMSTKAASGPLPVTQFSEWYFSREATQCRSRRGNRPLVNAMEDVELPWCMALLPGLALPPLQSGAMTAVRSWRGMGAKG